MDKILLTTAKIIVSYAAERHGYKGPVRAEF